MASAPSLAELGTLVLSTGDPLTKSKLSHLAYSRWRQENLPIGASEPPGRPCSPSQTPIGFPKGNSSSQKLGELLGDGFFADFAHVADDESRHFAWCSQRLAELGFRYGDMPAHNLLWRECEKSADNVTARLAAIPLVQEARGLDAGPRLVQKLIGFGDCRTSNIVARIADEEVAHVAVGVYWFVSVCQKMGCAPCSTFKDLLKEDWYDTSCTNKQDKNGQLSEVYDRLACIISMEKENSSLNKPPQ
ncbi:hypothetical protein F0562_008486 [Nyssa sinensis]|uniref:DUF455 domain-containing protein n=1 Tax=Nyssa sinensis TaxID=561372 RepID=A0A5J5AAH1_9ASTE|nr:hypothetical protein F0562_008486 [Nyssa sinensis]